MKMKKFFKRIFCFHLNWKRDLLDSRLYSNYYLCCFCGKRKNFGFRQVGWLNLPNYPINYDINIDSEN